MMLSKNAKISDLLGNIATNVAFCGHCRAKHNLNEDTYVGVFGNIMVGKTGGLVGNNLNDEGKVANASVWCRKKECLQGLAGTFMDECVYTNIDVCPQCLSKATLGPKGICDRCATRFALVL